jgi:putative oxidoreductase
MSLELNLLAKMLIGFFFVYYGFSNCLQRKSIIDIMRQKKIPCASWVFYLGVITQTICGMLIMLNQFLDISASILIIFDIAAVFIFHRFWTFEGEIRRLNQIIFVSNLSVVIGALILVADSNPLLFIIGLIS